jgi:hypothetical protein
MDDVLRFGADCRDARRLSIAAGIHVIRNLMVWNAAINCMQVARDIVMVSLR